jgi:pyruvate-ferredoxin/flavodoxin oxidoreductase
MGVDGDPLLRFVGRLRASAGDVSALKLVVLRPFPGARIVKALSRSLAVTVVEAVDRPLAQSNPLALEIKAAFADALTWAPGYPGVGRIPRILSSVLVGGRRVAEADLDAMIENMLSGDRGERIVVRRAGVSARTS